MKPVLVFSICFLLLGCAEKTEDLQLDFGYDYFPLEVGKYRIYEVDSIIYDPRANNVVIDSTTSQVREIVANTLQDNTGEIVYRIERYERQTSDDPWRIAKVFIQERNETRAFQIEDNFRVIKMVFPLQVGKEWNAHVFFDSTEVIVPVAGESINIFKDWSWQILETDASVSLDGLSFDQVATIQLSDSENLIELRKASEQYAAGVGLIYREMDILDTQCEFCCDLDFAACNNLPWAEKAEKGFTIRQRLIEHN